MKNNLFEEIDKEKKDLPDFSKLSKKIFNFKHLNFYQIVAVIIMAIGLVSGIMFGNLFPACKQTGGFFETCTKETFNFSLTLIIWCSTFLFAMFIFAIGHIISLLEEIKEQGKDNIKN